MEIRTVRRPGDPGARKGLAAVDLIVVEEDRTPSGPQPPPGQVDGESRTCPAVSAFCAGFRYPETTGRAPNSFWIKEFANRHNPVSHDRWTDIGRYLPNTE